MSSSSRFILLSVFTNTPVLTVTGLLIDRSFWLMRKFDAEAPCSDGYVKAKTLISEYR
jgi:hypothetical protein